MKREEQERRARQQRMLARALEESWYDIPSPDAEPEPPAPGPVPDPPPRQARTAAEEPPPSRLSIRLQQMETEKRRRQRRRYLLLGLLVVVLALMMAALTGVLGNTLAMLGDVSDGIYLSINRSTGSWPANTNISNPLQIEALGGGFVALDKKDVVIYTSYGGKIRSIQPSYARPALTVGNTRFAVYNRAGSELMVESRTRNLYTQKFPNPIMLCQMAPNGTLAVVTESDRYAAELLVYDPSFREDYHWYLTQREGTPVTVAFWNDSRHFATGNITAQDGQLCSTIYLMDTAVQDIGAQYTAELGSLILRLHWLSNRKVLAIFDDYAVILDAETGGEVARYDYEGTALQAASVEGKHIALLVSGRSGNDLVTLDENLQVLATAAVGQAKKVTCAENDVFLLNGDLVQRYGYDGLLRSETTYETRPIAVLSASETLVFYGTTVEPVAYVTQRIPAQSDK